MIPNEIPKKVFLPKSINEWTRVFDSVTVHKPVEGRRVAAIDPYANGYAWGFCQPNGIEYNLWRDLDDTWRLGYIDGLGDRELADSGS